MVDVRTLPAFLGSKHSNSREGNSMPVSRRGLLAGTAVAGAALAIPGTASAAVVTAAGDTIRPDDARYQDLVLRGQNRRFVAKPHYARVIRSTEDAVAAVQEAV